MRSVTNRLSLISSPNCTYISPDSTTPLHTLIASPSDSTEIGTASMEPPAAAEVATKTYWRFNKEDFFPEPSFQNLTAYKASVSQTCVRLKDRLFDRSSDETELLQLKKQSENDMKKCLTWWDLIWIGFGSVIGSGIFSITGQEAHNHAGPSIVLSYALSGLSALLSVFCYTEFAVEIPVAGGSFSFIRIELGDFIAFIAGGNLLLEGIVGSAGLGRAWTSYFTSLFTSNPNFLRIHVNSLAEGFNYLDPIGVVVIAITNSIAMSGTSRTSFLNWVASIFGAIAIVFIIIVGFFHANTSNLEPFFPFGAVGMFRAAAVVYWSYTGFDMVATMAEETKKPSRDIPLGLVGSMSMISVVYCLMALALAMMVKYTEIDVNAAYSVAFEMIGMKWAKYLVGLCALKGMTTSLLVSALGQARYTTQIARAHMIPPYFALVHPKTGTPINATLLITICSCIVGFFSSLDVLADVLSLSTLFVFMLMAVALLVRRYYVRDTTRKKHLVKAIVCIFVIIGSSIAITALWNSNFRGWIVYVVAVGFWFLGTLGMALLPKQRLPKVWGVPLVPWLPSLSIVMNFFLIGSLGWLAFLRFFICSAIMLVYYLFVGVHATYDIAHQNQGESTKLEQGNATANEATL